MSESRDVADALALDELLKSRGWALVHAAMKDDIVALAMLMAENRSLTKDQIDFMRGSMWAAKQLIDVPQKLRRKLESDITLANATRAATAAQE